MVEWDTDTQGSVCSLKASSASPAFDGFFASIFNFLGVLANIAEDNWTFCIFRMFFHSHRTLWPLTMALLSICFASVIYPSVVSNRKTWLHTGTSPETLFPAVFFLFFFLCFYIFSFIQFLHPMQMLFSKHNLFNLISCSIKHYTWCLDTKQGVEASWLWLFLVLVRELLELSSCPQSSNMSSLRWLFCLDIGLCCHLLCRGLPPQTTGSKSTFYTSAGRSKVKVSLHKNTSNMCTYSITLLKDMLAVWYYQDLNVGCLVKGYLVQTRFPTHHLDKFHVYVVMLLCVRNTNDLISELLDYVSNSIKLFVKATQLAVKYKWHDEL